MKIYIILTLIALASGAEWQRKTETEWKQIEKTCIQRHKVSEELMNKVNTEKYIPIEVFETFFCFYRGAEVWSDSEGFLVDRMMIALDSIADEKHIIKKAIHDNLEICNVKNSEGSPPLEWAYRCFQCFTDNEVLNKVVHLAKFYE